MSQSLSSTEERSIAIGSLEERLSAHPQLFGSNHTKVLKVS